MKYMLMMNVPGGPYRITEWAPEDFEAHVDFMKDLADDLHEAGKLVAAEGLTGPDEAKLVRAADEGTPITDGAFAETKEYVAGFWIVEVDGPEEACEIAARVSAAPGPEGEPLNMGIEVRQVMSGPPEGPS